MVAVVGGFFGGWFVDKWLGTTPLFTLAASLLGTAAAIYVVLRDVRRLVK